MIAVLATSLGVRSPRTVALPNKAYVPGIVHEESLRNLKYLLYPAALAASRSSGLVTAIAGRLIRWV